MEEIVNLERRTVTDAVYEQLRKDIIEMFYQPGERLSEQKIAQRYGVSRDPVRKAVSRLVQENLLISKPQCGTFVSELSIKQGREVCEIRLLLEAHAVRTACAHIPQEELDQLVSDLEKTRRIAEEEDEEEARQYIYRLDEQMHRIIWKYCGNEMIGSIIRSYDFIVKRIQISNMQYHRRKSGTLLEMGKIILALAKKDVDAAVKAMEIHIGNIKKTLVESQ